MNTFSTTGILLQLHAYICFKFFYVYPCWRSFSTFWGVKNDSVCGEKLSTTREDGFSDLAGLVWTLCQRINWHTGGRI